MHTTADYGQGSRIGGAPGPAVPHAIVILLAAVSIALAAAIGAMVPQYGVLILAGMLAAGFTVLCALRPDIGVLFIGATIPVEQAAMFEGNVTATRVIGVIVAAGWIANKILRRERLDRPFTRPLVILCLGFLAYSAVSTMWAPYYSGTVTRIATLAQLVVLAVIVADLGSRWQRLDRIAKSLLVGALLAAALILVQYASGGVRRAGENIAAGDMNSAARLLVMVMPIAFYLLMSQQRSVWRLIGVAYLGAATIAVVATFSRSSLVLLPLVLVAQYAIAMRHRVRLRWLAVPLIVLVFGIRFVPMDRIEERVATIAPYLGATLTGDPTGEVQSSRGYHLRIGLAIFRDHPILGAGYHSYGDHFLRYQFEVAGADRLYRSRRSSHGSHWGLLADLGLVGISLWIALLVVVPIALIRGYRRLSRESANTERLLVLAILVSVALNIPYGATAEIHKFKLFWFFIGMAIAASELSRQKLRAPTGHLAEAPV
jgi:O-antigen ligase